MKLGQKEKVFLLKLSRRALTHIFKTGKSLEINNSDTDLDDSDIFRTGAATFVTLTKNGKLRGCIGKIVAQKELYKDVIENTYSAAFNDPRFPQLSEKELDEIKIEISILSKPKKLKIKNPKKILRKLEKEKPGVVLEMGLHSATFLPQVWEELKTPKEFLSRLCLKADLPEDMWKNENIKISTYTVEKFREE